MKAPDFDRVAYMLLRSCGGGRILDVGWGGMVAAALARRGADVLAVEPGRALPFEDASFDVVALHAESLAGTDAAAALADIRRVASGPVFVWSFPEPGDAAVPAARRSRWEGRCFEAGLRKHPAYYTINDYESLNHEAPLVCIPLEKLPAEAFRSDPLESLDAERGLHMDMLRDSGERSDAHVARYHWAAGYVKPGDRVLDAACGLGYGSHVLLRLSDAASVTGIDDSDRAIAYATRNYSAAGRSRYVKGSLPHALAEFDDGSFETIVSFETLEHLGAPESLLAEFHRLLTPGGRLLVSVPNDWSDETGKDPNPYHLQVYDWTRLRRELGGPFILEQAFAQTASQCKVRARGNVWEPRPRLLRNVEFAEDAPADCEWWLMSGMKSPIDAAVDYRERVFANIAASGHPSIDYAGNYRNPWLMHAMVSVTWRLRNGEELERLAGHVLEASPADSNDYAAALCVKSYRVLERAPSALTEAADAIELIDAVVATPPGGPMGLRWKVSLLFVRARLLQAIGRLEEARASFQECGRLDVRPFGIHLATKPTEAWFLAGKIAAVLGDAAGARTDWEAGIAYGEVLLGSAIGDIVIDPRFPNRFNHGDGVREFTLAWDNIARCANGLHLLARGRPLDESALETSFQVEYAEVTRAVLEAHSDLAQRTDELVETRRTLSERTRQVEAALRERTEDLVATRQTLVERTRMLEAASDDLRTRTDELVQTRQLLAERTRLLEAATAGLPDAARELIQVQAVLFERTRDLEAASMDLQLRTAELVDTRAALEARTRLLEGANRDLTWKEAELVEVHGLLEERTRMLEEERRRLADRTRDLARTRETLGERTGQFDNARRQLHQRNEEFAATRRALAEREVELAEREAQLAAAQRDLAETARLLDELRQELAGIVGAPFRFASRSLYRRILRRNKPGKG